MAEFISPAKLPPEVFESGSDLAVSASAAKSLIGLANLFLGFERIKLAFSGIIDLEGALFSFFL